VERNREAGQNPPRVVAPSEEEEEVAKYGLHVTSDILCIPDSHYSEFFFLTDICKFLYQIQQSETKSTHFVIK
jgi:hypothetical protein